jgi:hypothetical protein
MTGFFLIALSAVFLGVELGIRFKVLIIVPALAAASGAALAFGMAQGMSLGSVLLMVAVALAALQLGYLTGAVVRLVIAGATDHRQQRARPALTLQRSAPSGSQNGDRSTTPVSQTKISLASGRGALIRE